MPADLHCHSRLSDGSTALEDIITIAKLRKLDGIAITDHDTLAGVTRAKVLGDRHGINVIPGIELSCYDFKRDRRVHILAYLFSYPDRIEGLCRRVGEARRESAAKMIAKVRRFYPITSDMVMKAAAGSTNVYKQHIMQALMNAGYSTTIFGELYTKLFDYENGSCSVKNEYPDVFEVIEVLKSAEAVIVLAHPSVYDSMELLPELIEAGIHGVEVWHPRNKPEDIERLLELAKEHQLVTTGGTDFHGMYTSRALPLGTRTTPDDCLAALYACKDRIKKQSKK
ncbi:MAG: PHP domain-containing protein [Clostridia bacterium]|nr:PHP domain-containing protein [Clostridia bacterium]